MESSSFLLAKDRNRNYKIRVTELGSKVSGVPSLVLFFRRSYFFMLKNGLIGFRS
jgi:hypothetical protein